MQSIRARCVDRAVFGLGIECLIASCCSTRLRIDRSFREVRGTTQPAHADSNQRQHDDDRNDNTGNLTRCETWTRGARGLRTRTRLRVVKGERRWLHRNALFAQIHSHEACWSVLSLHRDLDDVVVNEVLRCVGRQNAEVCKAVQRSAPLRVQHNLRQRNTMKTHSSSSTTARTEGVPARVKMHRKRSVGSKKPCAVTLPPAETGLASSAIASNHGGISSVVFGQETSKGVG